MSPVELADAYLKGAADLRAAVAGMTRDQLVAHPVEGRWSTLEVVAHLADFEPVFGDRILRVLALGDGTPLLAADENEFARALNYHDRDVDEELAVVDAVRRKHARVLRGVRPEQWQWTGTHSKRGRVTLEWVVRMAVNHIPHHLPYIAEKRAALSTRPD